MVPVLSDADAIRLACFLGALVILTLAEAWSPRRVRTYSRWVRWPSNLGVVVLNAAALRIAVPGSGLAVALVAAKQSWGLLNNLPISPGFALVLAVVLLDLAIYLQHILFHAIPVLWRLHRVHHADLDFDATTGLRFHPIEIVLSMGIKMGAVAALGAPVLAVLVFEILLNATSLFNHANLRLPLRLDRVLRCFVVTPDMHRVHHSSLPQEANRNFGFNLPWWDRVFGTYRAQPRLGHERMTIGVDQFRTGRDLRLDRMLVQPFLGATGVYPIARPDENPPRSEAPPSTSA